MFIHFELSFIITNRCLVFFLLCSLNLPSIWMHSKLVVFLLKY